MFNFLDLCIITALVMCLVQTRTAAEKNNLLVEKCGEYQELIPRNLINCTASSIVNKDYSCQNAFDGIILHNKEGSAWAAKGKRNAWIEVQFKKKVQIEEVRILQRYKATDNAKKITIPGLKDVQDLIYIGSTNLNILTLSQPLRTSKFRINILEANLQESPGNVGFKEILIIGCHIKTPPEKGKCGSFQEIPKKDMSCSASSTHKNSRCENALDATGGRTLLSWIHKGQKNPWFEVHFKEPYFVEGFSVFQRDNLEDIFKEIEVLADQRYITTFSNIIFPRGRVWNSFVFPNPVRASDLRLNLKANLGHGSGNTGFKELIIYGCPEENSKIVEKDTDDSGPAKKTINLPPIRAIVQSNTLTIG